MVLELIPSEGFRPSKPLQTTPSEGMGSSKHLSTTLPKVWAFQVSSNSPFPRVLVWGGSPKHLSKTPSEGFGPSRRQTTPPKPLRSPSEAHFKQPLREDGFQKTGSRSRHGHPAAAFLRRSSEICRKGWLKDVQSPKGLVEGGVEKWRGSRAERWCGGR